MNERRAALIIMEVLKGLEDKPARQRVIDHCFKQTIVEDLMPTPKPQLTTKRRAARKGK